MLSSTTYQGEALIEILLLMNAIITLPSTEMNPLDRVEVEIVQQLMARILERNGIGTTKHPDKTYSLAEGCPTFAIQTPRESLYAVLQELMHRQGIDCYCDQRHFLNNSRCLGCHHLAVLTDPSASASELNLSLGDVILRLGELSQ